MPISIGSNIASLRAQRRLSDGTFQLSKTLERLSSGARINSASDDAAGLAISESLRADRRVFQQGVRNLNDGISLLSIADSAIENLSNIVTRLKELAEQSANGTYSGVQRVALNKEAQALSNEYTRIIATTEFNGLGLLNGNVSQMRLQAGYGIDGSLNIVLGEEGSDTVGTGSFNSITTFSAGASSRDITSADFNGDGILDLALGGGAAVGHMNVMFGVGDGTFGAAASYANGSAATSLSAVDLNNDGATDIVAIDNSNSKVNVYLNNGNGTFAARVSYATGTISRMVKVGDFNGDGIHDLATNDRTGDSVSILIGNGDGTFDPAVSFAVDNDPFAFTLGDFNGDGDTDIITTHTGGSTSVLLGAGDGSFSVSSTFASSAVEGISAGDFNNDGNLDFISMAGGTFHYTVLYLGAGDGTFDAGTSFATGSQNSSLTVADFNGDGNLDFVTSQFNNTANVRLGNGDGTFGERVTYNLGTTPVAMITGDTNQDGVLDLITTQSNTVGILLAETTIGSAGQGISPLETFSLSNITEARQALDYFSANLQYLASERGKLGAFQNRIQAALATLSVTSENYQTAESRIRDADMGYESSQLVRLNILQQAASAVLGQANQQPNIALGLLTA